MFFREMIESEEEWTKYEQLLSKLSQFVSDCVGYLKDAYDVVERASFGDQCYSHATVLMLARHIIESNDGVSVLVERGCAQNCGPLLRSAFEGQLGVLYILEDDNKRRALAYQVAHCHRRITMYRRCDPNDSLGKQLRAELKNDPIADVFDEIPGDKIKMIANLEQMLLKPEFAPIELEWQTIRKNKDPAWFSLFNGPRDIRALAMRLRVGSLYEGLYRTWSDFIHAGSGFSNIGASDQPGAIAIRPIRHPEGLETACSLAAQICVNTARNLVHTYASEKTEQFRQKYLNTISSRYMKVCKGKIIIAPWRKTQTQ